ncbi:hypothetical protein CgunFtcFv8_007785 [Champsocephalus gunnari]|uniref:Uncharacterized protein n=1 Tax=Champsocephalus gunnari TaxID=52237 RepID=A0AAN8CHS7_CHAGU|nr:hypothetical protein CgunFtcFv8_007785 [Champsocephalus gunnari]
MSHQLKLESAAMDDIVRAGGVSAGRLTVSCSSAQRHASTSQRRDMSQQCLPLCPASRGQGGHVSLLRNALIVTDE